jgi:endonuclease-3
VKSKTSRKTGTKPGAKAGARASEAEPPPRARPARKRWEPRAPTADHRARAEEVLRRLRQTYPDAECALVHRNAYELTVATILSAQCTDARVNMVTPEVFQRWPTPAALARADRREVEEVVRSTGFFRNKAKNIQGMAQRVVEAYGGEIPKAMEDLLTLPGVARKTANVVRGVTWGLADGVVVDTHVRRLSKRLRFTRQDDPERIERELMLLFPREDWNDLGHLLIHHGRAICHARKPLCPRCPVMSLCPSAKPG